MFFYKCLCAGILPAVLVPAAAQNRLDSTQQIREVTVTAYRYAEVIPSQRLAGSRLEALGSFSVADAIRYFSGIQIKDYGGIGGLKTVDIRSMGSNHTGVFYDGLPLGNAQNGQVDLGKFSLDNVEEISLYNGQKSEILQPAKDCGSAGSIYLRTRRPHFAGGKTSNLKVLFRTGSFGLANPSVLWEQKTGGRTALSFNAEYVRASGRYPFRYRKVLHDGTVAWDTTAIRQNGDIRSLRLESGLNGFTEQGKWHVKAWFYDSEKGIPGAIVNNVWKRWQRQWDRNFFVQGSFRQPLSERLDLLANVKYAADRMRYLNPDTTLMYIDNTFLQQEMYASLAGKYAILPNWDASLSADYQWNTLEASLRDFVYPRRHTALAALGTAFEWRRLKAQASLLGTFVFDSATRIRRASAETPSGAQSGLPGARQEYTPAVFVSYRPYGGEGGRSPLQFRAFYKRIFRMPTFNDLYYTDAGNIALDPEYTSQYNVGVHYGRDFAAGAVRRVDFRADAYYNEVTDKIIAVPKGNGQYRWMMMNIGYVEIRGVDISCQASWLLPGGIRMDTGLNYTWQRAQDFSDPSDNDPRAGTYGGQIAYIPRHGGSVIVNVLRESWDLNYSFIYVGERYHNSSNIPANHEQPWYTHDLTAGKTFRLYRTLRCKLSAEVNNLFNQYYDVVQNYPMPGRNYKLVLRVEI